MDQCLADRISVSLADKDSEDGFVIAETGCRVRGDTTMNIVCCPAAWHAGERVSDQLTPATAN